MARKSPRSRKKQAKTRRFPGGTRQRSSPRKRRARTGAGAEGDAPQSRRGHAPKGARSSGAAAASKKRGGARTSDAAARRKRAPARRPRRSRFVPPDPQRVAHGLAILESLYPEATTELDFGTPLQLLIATILSAQCTDDRVNKVTPVLFAKYPDARALAEATQSDVEDVIRSTGFYRNKARAIRECCADIVTKHGGEVPATMAALTALRGVGRKTANVVLGNAFGIPGLVVDTHVSRLSNRLGLTDQTDPVKIESALMPIVPRDKWTLFSHWLILHGRRVCIARRPRCSICALAPQCPRVNVKASQ